MPFVNAYWIFFLAVIYGSPVQEKVYEGAQVWQATLSGQDDILLIKRLVENQDISIWSLCRKKADFLVLPNNKVKVHRELLAHNLSHTVLINNVQQRIDTHTAMPSLWTETTLRDGHRLSWKKYPTLNIIEEYFNFLAEDYSSICRLQSIGVTAENRTIKMINITNGNPKNKIILITGGQHAREWISVTSALYIIHNIVTEFDAQKSYMKDKNWLIIPVVNPDGYAYTHDVDRLWRKNRRQITDCNGVDINRNFETDWRIPGITQYDECKHTFSGPRPFSEAESKALRDLILSLSSKPTALVDLHAYGKLILFPWSGKTHATPDHKMHKEVASRMRTSIYKTAKENYTFGSTYHLVYPASGTFVDWAYTNGVTHAYVIESRDKGELGFLLPPEEIEDTGKELFAAVRSLSKFITISNKSNLRNGDNQTWF